MKRFLKYGFPSVMWLAVIFMDSTDLMSAEHTSRFIVPFLRWLDPHISFEALTSIHFIIRKSAHVVEYAILGWLLLRAAIFMTNDRWRRSTVYVSVWTICLFVAATDELHQTFVPSRGASLRDVMIDSAGAILGVLTAAVFTRCPTPFQNDRRAINV